MTSVLRVVGESDSERREHRKALLAQLAASEPKRVDPSAASIAEGARLLLEAVERGDEVLFGYPRERIDFARAYRMLGKGAANGNGN